MHLPRTEFERLVEQAIAALPERFASHLENVEVVVEDFATPEELESVGIGPRGTLLGLYQGIPQNQRGSWYGNVLPDRIVLYQRPIESMSRDRREVRRQIGITLRHEIGHHFGLREDELTDAGYE